MRSYLILFSFFITNLLSAQTIRDATLIRLANGDTTFISQVSTLRAQFPDSTSARNVPGGIGVYWKETNNQLVFKSLIAGSNITITSGEADSTITISSTVGSVTLDGEVNGPSTATTVDTVRRIWFDRTYNQPDSIGKLQWDANEQTLQLGLGNTTLSTVLDVGQETLYPKVINNTSAIIKKGTPVMVDTVGVIQGDNIRVRPAIGSTARNVSTIMGVAVHDIGIGETGFVTWFGHVTEVNHTDIAQTGITLDTAQILYLSSTEPGKFTNVIPTAPNLKVPMAIVVRKPTANNMTLLVRPQLTPDIHDVNDVSISNPTAGQVLQYNSGGFWENGQVQAAGIAANSIDSSKIANGTIRLEDLNQSGATNGQIIKWNGSQWGVSNDSITGEIGRTWISRGPLSNNTYTGITYGEGLFVAVSRLGTNRVLTSSNGVTWVERSASQANSWRSVTYGKGLFVAVSDDGTNRVMTSPDGITWTNRTASQANSWWDVTYGNGLFVAVATTGTNRVMTSPDGVTWTNRTAAEANEWYGVTYGNGLFVAVSRTGTNRVMTSPDGITWTARAAANTAEWEEVKWGGGLFVAVANNSNTSIGLMTSPDGITWTSRTKPITTALLDIEYGSGIFIATPGAGGSQCLISTDGITWTAHSMPTAQYVAIAYGNNLFAALGTNHLSTSGNYMTLAQQGADVGNVLKWDGNYWTPAIDSVGSGGTGTVTTSGTPTTDRLAKFTGSTVIGNSLITDNGTNVTIGGTNSLIVPNGTTVQRPTASSGMVRYNTDNSALEYYDANSWEAPLISETQTGLGSNTKLFFGSSTGKATFSDSLQFNNGILAINPFPVSGSAPLQIGTVPDVVNIARGIRIAPATSFSGRSLPMTVSIRDNRTIASSAASPSVNIAVTNIDVTNDNYSAVGFNGILTNSNSVSYAGINCVYTSHDPATYSADFIFFLANNAILSSVMTLKSSGNLGIGVTAPENRLQVAGSFGRKTPVTVAASTYTVLDDDTWIIVNNAGTCTITLPTASAWDGREIIIKTITSNPVISASSNIIPMGGGSAQTSILSSTKGAWATLVSNGTNWEIMQSGDDNTLSMILACSDETTNLTTGTSKVTFRAPKAMTITEVRANVNTASVGSTIIVDINEGGVSILGTKLSIDANEKTSVTAASAATITDTSIADDAEVTIDIDQVGSTTPGKGLKVTIYYR